MTQATVVTHLSYHRPLFLTILPTVVSRRIVRSLLYKKRGRYESVVFAQVVPYPPQIWERSVVAKRREPSKHYNDVIMGTIASQITSLTIVYSTVYSGADQRKHQSSASLAFVRGIHRWPVNSPHKWPVTRKMFPFDDVIMNFSKRSAASVPSWRLASRGCSSDWGLFQWNSN